MQIKGQDKERVRWRQAQDEEEDNGGEECGRFETRNVKVAGCGACGTLSFSWHDAFVPYST